MDAYFHVHLKPWDYCAAKLIVEEAGGIVQQIDGQPIGIWEYNLGLIATNGKFHDHVLNAINVPEKI
jgi:myo-inositol-1(or 4)-monophosphatase